MQGIQVIFNPSNPKTYTYKCTLNDINVDDVVVVETGNSPFGYSVAKVVKLGVDLPDDVPYEYKYVVSVLKRKLKRELEKV